MRRLGPLSAAMRRCSAMNATHSGSNNRRRRVQPILDGEHRLFSKAVRMTVSLLVVGLLVRPAKAQIVMTGYEYDALGNRVAVANLVRPLGARVVSFSPPVAINGELVNIFGQNLPAGNPLGIIVTFNGSPAEIASVGSTVITVAVP